MVYKLNGMEMFNKADLFVSFQFRHERIQKRTQIQKRIGFEFNRN